MAQSPAQWAMQHPALAAVYERAGRPARVTAALCGTLAVWLLYLAGTRLFDRRVGLLAAGLLGVSFPEDVGGQGGLAKIPER